MWSVSNTFTRVPRPIYAGWMELELVVGQRRLTARRQRSASEAVGLRAAVSKGIGLALVRPLCLCGEGGD